MDINNNNNNKKPIVCVPQRSEKLFILLLFRLFMISESFQNKKRIAYETS